MFQFIDNKFPTRHAVGQRLIQVCLIGDVFIADNNLLPVQQQHQVIIATHEVGFGHKFAALIFCNSAFGDERSKLQYLISKVDTSIQVLIIVRELSVTIGVVKVVDVYPSLVVYSICTENIQICAECFYRPSYFTGGVRVAMIKA